MPVPRAFAIVTCSCGLRIGDLRRATAHEEMEAAEPGLIENEVPRLVRHWRLGHELTVSPRAPLAAKAVIAKAAREMAETAEPSGETGMVRR